MEYFHYRDGELYCEEMSVARVADKVGTPLYLYSQSSLEAQFRAFDQAFAPAPHITCYAVKANSNLAVLSLFRSLGAGFDIVSGGELNRALTAGADPRKIIFSGVGKTLDEIDLGLKKGILQFNVESAAELSRIEGRARSLGTVGRVALRVNPGVNARTHPYIATGLREHKFGVSVRDAHELYRRARSSRHLRATGVSCHIGSQITSVKPFQAALRRLRRIFRDLRADGVKVQFLDVGGGLGIVYDQEQPPPAAEYAQSILPLVRDLDCTLILEPGRVIAGNAGILVTRVILTKQTGRKHFVVVDAGMSEFIRPSLYGAYHGIRTVSQPHGKTWKADVVGPICESGDFFARGRRLPVVAGNDLLAIMSTGAYGFVLSSNYNTRSRPAEVLVRGRAWKVIRHRERFRNIIRGESMTPLP